MRHSSGWLRLKRHRLLPFSPFLLLSQERDSMMCGQHALNNLLQGAYFYPTDLAAIASQLDDEEDATLDGPHRNRDSVNMDDSGFFSLSTLDRCAQVWGLSLGTRWRSEEMRPYHDKPESVPFSLPGLAWFLESVRC
jgi:hypothetical protein